MVIGATAIQLWGSSRATREVDLRIDATHDNAERVLLALSGLPFGVAHRLIPDDILSRGVTMIGDTPNVDVLTRAWNVSWAEANHEIAVFEVEDVPIPTISLALLIASWRAGRAQDIADLAVLDAIQAIRGI